jgi:hypothetical protein
MRNQDASSFAGPLVVRNSTTASLGLLAVTIVTQVFLFSSAGFSQQNPMVSATTTPLPQVSPTPAPKADYTGRPAETASRLAMLFDSTRKVISDNQKVINDPALGDKNLGVERMLVESLKIFANKATGGVQGPYEENLIEAIKAVIEDAQPVLNERGKTFKGFIPAVYGKRLTEVFNARMKGRSQMHLTAPKDLVRNLTNLPDEWEANIIESKFKSKDWKKGMSFTENLELKGKKVFRSISPQYYAESCLSCHGGQKGKKDITGGVMEGAALGDVGGALSVMLFL